MIANNPFAELRLISTCPPVSANFPIWGIKELRENNISGKILAPRSKSRNIVCLFNGFADFRTLFRIIANMAKPMAKQKLATWMTFELIEKSSVCTEPSGQQRHLCQNCRR